MKTTPSMTQQASQAFWILTGSSSDGRDSTTLAMGATIATAPAEHRVELVRGVLDAFAGTAPRSEPFMGLAALLR